MFASFDLFQWSLLALIFVWTGFVRTALGFGGAALSLPLMLLLAPQPLQFLPVIGTHLLVFSSLTLANRLHNVDWHYLRRALAVMLLPMAAGLAGLLSLPGETLSVLVFSITLLYGISYLIGRPLRSQNRWVDSVLLAGGGYAAGASLIGAPLIVAVFTRHVEPHQLRDTLFVTWIVFVLIKMSTFIATGVDLHWRIALLLLPVAAVGHMAGLRVHDAILASDGKRIRRLIGVALVLVTCLGLVRTGS